MSASPAAPADPLAEPPADQLRTALGELLGAERRLRARDPHGGAGSYAQARALALLADAGEATAGRIAQAAGLTPAGMSGLLDQLEADGTVVRRRDAHDRRRVVVSLTPTGRELLAGRRARWNACWQEVVGGLSDDELAAAAGVMRRIARTFDAL